MKACSRCAEVYADDVERCPRCSGELKKTNDPLLGRTISARYRLIKRLGTGGMSSVYLARHVVIERLNAIKILRQDLSMNPAHRERFLREARAVNRIHHRNIIEITDYGEADGTVYLVMEYVSGAPLLTHIQQGALAWPRAVKIAVQIASALGRAHQAGVIHRDLKPENVMLVAPDASGPGIAPFEEDDVAKLMDFGIAKLVDAPALTFSEQLFGTPGYIAPEYLEGDGGDARADLYSLGVVLYEMLTGSLPYDARGQAPLLLAPLTRAPIPPSAKVRGLPAELESIVLHMLAKKPDDRPPDAFVVQDTLADLLQHYAGSSAPPPVAPVPRAPSDTLVDSSGRSARPTPAAGKLVTGEASPRWQTALMSIAELIARARASGGAGAKSAEEATVLAKHAAKLVERVEWAAQQVSELQAKVDRLEAQGREFRATFGRAVDELVHERSRERAHLDALRGRRDSVGSLKTESRRDQVLWEKATLAEEEARARAVEEDLTSQIDALERELETKNETLDRELAAATGALEGVISGMRLIGNEIAKTLDEAVALVSA
jgi:serine/threonine-protein kinase